MKWLKNLENISKENTPGKCPYCGSLDTEYTAIRIKRNMGYAVIWCNNCSNACNVSRVQITDKTIVNKAIPNGLKFTIY